MFAIIPKDPDAPQPRPSISRPPFTTLSLRHSHPAAPVLSEHPERIRGEAMKRRHVDVDSNGTPKLHHGKCRDGLAGQGQECAARSWSQGLGRGMGAPLIISSRTASHEVITREGSALSSSSYWGPDTYSPKSPSSS